VERGGSETCLVDLSYLRAAATSMDPLREPCSIIEREALGSSCVLEMGRESVYGEASEALLAEAADLVTKRYGDAGARASRPQCRGGVQERIDR
jgi:hypothetical protein